MRQIFFDSSRRAVVKEVDPPASGPGQILIDVEAAVISPGTETADYAIGGLVGRAAHDPRLVRRLFDTVQKTGIREAVNIVRSKVAGLTPTGYSGAGRVVAVSTGVSRFAPGDRVAYVGAAHAERVASYENLTAHVPENLSFEEAAFGALGSIALHGVRLAEPTLGETCLVVGLGLVGQLVVQLSVATGLRVIATEPIVKRRELALELGAATVLDPLLEDDVTSAVAQFTGGTGVDIVFLCAATRNEKAAGSALRLARDRGRVVMVGNMPMALDRALFFSKELIFRVSRSYGPGRYDRRYEELGFDYPLGFVRWSENRNLQCFLDLASSSRIALEPLISRRVPFEAAPEGYEALANAPASELAVVITRSPTGAEPARSSPAPRLRRTKRSSARSLGVIGAGAFAQSNLLPHVKDLGWRVRALANATNRAFPELQTRFEPDYCTTNYHELLNDPHIDAVIVATRHSSHYEIARAAVQAGKSVHVEKPMTVTRDEAVALAAAVREMGGLLTVGFNRRHAPLTQDIKRVVANLGPPVQLVYRINAGALPAAHWVRDPNEGGGRLVGEGCHFFDLARYLAGSEVRDVTCRGISGSAAFATFQENFCASLTFENGSLASIVYSSLGNSALPKERLELFVAGRVYVLDDFKRLDVYGASGSRVLPRPEKGFREHLANFFAAVEGRQELLTTELDGVAVAEVVDHCLESRAVSSSDPGRNSERS